MADGLNKVMLIGNLGTDPEMRYTANGSAVTTFRLAVSRSFGGEVVDVNHWGRRRLAYPIKRHFEGNYVVSQIRLDPGSVSDLEGGLRISEEILRHLVVQAGE